MTSPPSTGKAVQQISGKCREKQYCTFSVVNQSERSYQQHRLQLAPSPPASLEVMIGFLQSGFRGSINLHELHFSTLPALHQPPVLEQPLVPADTHPHPLHLKTRLNISVLTAGFDLWSDVGSKICASGLIPHQRGTISITSCLSIFVLSLHLPDREEFFPNLHVNLSLVPCTTPGCSLFPTRSSCGRKHFHVGFVLLSHFKRPEMLQELGCGTPKWGFGSLAGKNHESQSTGALRDMELPNPCRNLRTHGVGGGKSGASCSHRAGPWSKVFLQGSAHLP